MSQPITDPSFSIHQDVLPHIHLVSSWRLPIKPRLEIVEVVKWLREAPQIARDKAPFYWTYLDRLTDGTSLLTWQPIHRRGVAFASDGYIWNGPEQLYTQDVGDGLLLEMYCHKSGFMPPREPVTLHSRRRFRLVPVPHQSNPAAVDVNLWVVHWAMSDPQDRMPSNLVPIDERTGRALQYRDYLLHFELPRKEFMLSDHINWPAIHRDPNIQGGPPRLLAAAPPPPPIPQQMAYPPAGHVVIPPHSAVAPLPPPSAGPQPHKRARQSSGAGPSAPHLQQQPLPPPQSLPPLPHSHPQSQQPTDSALIDDVEDNWRGDFFDHFTPRELALERFCVNHEWMEELLASNYSTQRIIPPDLGLGLAGDQLGRLTEGIFEPPRHDGPPEKPYLGKLDPGLADEFRQRVREHLAATEAEMNQMREDHQKQLSKLQARSRIMQAEKALRGVSETETPAEGSAESGEGGGGGHAPANDDEIVADIEKHLGKKIELRAVGHRVRDGGYRPAPPPPPPPPPPAPAQTPIMGQHPQTPSIGQQHPQTPPIIGQQHPHNPAIGQHPQHPPHPHPSGIGHHPHVPGISQHPQHPHAPGMGQHPQLPQHAQNPPHPAGQSSSPVVSAYPASHSAVAAVPSAAYPVHPSSATGTPPIGHPAAGYPSQQHQQHQQQLARAGTPQTTPDQGTGSGDWILVPKGSGADHGAVAAGPSAASRPHPPHLSHLPPQSPQPNLQQQQQPHIQYQQQPHPHPQQYQQQQQQQEQLQPRILQQQHQQPPPLQHQPQHPQGSALIGSPHSGIGGFGPAFGGPDFATLGELNSASEALDSFGSGQDLNMDMDGSAFGEAFAGVNASAGNGSGNGHGSDT